MPRHILQLPDGTCLEWSTVVDAPVSRALPRREFEAWYLEEYGSSSADELAQRLKRVDQTGTSARGLTAAELISINLAGPGGRQLTLDEVALFYGHTRNDDLSRASLEEIYSQGECHVFAMACHMMHGGDFLVAYNAGRIHFESDDGDVQEVIHVFSRHITPDGVVLRDIFGDRHEDFASLTREVAERFEVTGSDVLLEVMDADELLALINDPEEILEKVLQASAWPGMMEQGERPLSEADAADLCDALALPDVQAAPGARLAAAPRTETAGTCAPVF